MTIPAYDEAVARRIVESAMDEHLSVKMSTRTLAHLTQRARIGEIQAEHWCRQYWAAKREADTLRCFRIIAATLDVALIVVMFAIKGAW